MTPNRLRDIYRRRGFAVALVTARACKEHHLVIEVMLASLEATGFVRPVPRSVRNVRGAPKASGFAEGASLAEIMEVKTLHAQRHAAESVQPLVRSKPKVGQLTMEEKSRRMEALLALMTPNELAGVVARQAARRVAA